MDTQLPSPVVLAAQLGRVIEAAGLPTDVFVGVPPAPAEPVGGPTQQAAAADRGRGPRLDGARRSGRLWPVLHRQRLCRLGRPLRHQRPRRGRLDQTVWLSFDGSLDRHRAHGRAVRPGARGSADRCAESTCTPDARQRRCPSEARRPRRSAIPVAAGCRSSRPQSAGRSRQSAATSTGDRRSPARSSRCRPTSAGRQRRAAGTGRRHGRRSHVLRVTRRPADRICVDADRHRPGHHPRDRQPGRLSARRAAYPRPSRSASGGTFGWGPGALGCGVGLGLRKRRH